MTSSWRAFLALLLLLAPTVARADERILHFWSDVAIQPDSSLEVTETIDVRAERNAINHGIYRDFPTRYRGPHGSQFRVGFTFQGATLDGAPVPVSTAPKSNGIRIKIGDPDKFVDVGLHRYVIRYRTTRQVGRFKDYDELYWNATGNGWAFPIDLAEARIRLPQPVTLGQRSVYTGAQGSTEHSARVVEEKPGEIAFRTTRPLGPYEGLTVAVAFPKGVVAEADESTRLGWWLSDYGPPSASPRSPACSAIISSRGNRPGTTRVLGPSCLFSRHRTTSRPRPCATSSKWVRTTAPLRPRSSTWACAATSVSARKTEASSRATSVKFYS